MKNTVFGQKEPVALLDNQARMEIDQHGMNRLMTTMAGLYSEPALAVLREYTSNALDSHTAAKSRQAVQVRIVQGLTRGNRPGNVLEVEDFGVGMDEDDMRNVYRMYGASTKVDTNREIGGFGLGAKSALSITDTFTVRARKNGTEIVAEVTKDATGVGVLTFSTVQPTTAGNGVLIRIPLENNHYEAIRNAIFPLDFSENDKSRPRTHGKYGFFMGLPKKALTVNGQVLPSLYEGEKWLAVQSGREALGWAEIATEYKVPFPRDARLSPLSLYTSVLVGGVKYPVPYSALQTFRLADEQNWYQEFHRGMEGLTREHQSVVLNLPIGGVDLAPSREGLQITEKTVRTLWRVAKTFMVELPRAVESRMNSYPSSQDAFEFLGLNWRFTLHGRDIEKLDDTVDPSNSYWMSQRRYDVQAYPVDNIGISYRGFPIPRDIATGRHHLVNASEGAQRASWNESTLRFFEELSNRKNKNNADRRIVVEVPDLYDEHLQVVRNNVRGVIEGIYGTRSGSAYVFKGKAPAMLRYAYRTFSLDDLVEEAKRIRKQKRDAKGDVAVGVTFPSLRSGSRHVALIESKDVTDEYHYFHGADSRSVSKNHTSVARLFNDLKSKGRVESDWHELAASFTGAPLLVLPKERSTRTLHRYLPEKQNILWPLLHAAMDHEDEWGNESLAALVDVGQALVDESSLSRQNIAKDLTELHRSSGITITNLRLRHVFELLADIGRKKVTEEVRLALLLGSVNWSEFLKAHSQFTADEPLMLALARDDDSRFASWLQILHPSRAKKTQYNTLDQSANLIVMLEALAERHGW